MTDGMDNVAVADPTDVTMVERQERLERPPRRQPRYNVIVWNDDDHTYAYVIAMLMQLFGHTKETAKKMAEEVDATGKAIVLTTTMEHAELKRDQVHAFGTDSLVDECVGSMWATIEPALGT